MWSRSARSVIASILPTTPAESRRHLIEVPGLPGCAGCTDSQSVCRNIILTTFGYGGGVCIRALPAAVGSAALVAGQTRYAGWGNSKAWWKCN